jgi:hypothetical protein
MHNIVKSNFCFSQRADDVMFGFVRLWRRVAERQR